MMKWAPGPGRLGFVYNNHKWFLESEERRKLVSVALQQMISRNAQFSALDAQVQMIHDVRFANRIMMRF